MRYFYDIAGIHILMNIPFEVKIMDESRPFIREDMPDESEIDRFIEYKPVSHLDFKEEGGYWIVDDYHRVDPKEDRVYFCTVRGKEPYACRVQETCDLRHIICYYKEDYINEMNLSRNLLKMIRLDHLFCAFHGILLHSSLIRYQNKGIVFSAPSGTGKSTQADLWKAYEQADILNGDRSCIRKIEGRWYAYGLPMAGSSGIYRNERAEITGIVVLRQGKENEIKRLTPVEAFNGLYAECAIDRLDRSFVDKVVSLLCEIIRDCPIYLLSCRPDEGAVKLLKQTLFNE